MAIRQPVVAGTFYPGDKTALKKQLDSYFGQIKATENCSIVISPHAGYIYSGRIAAKSIANLIGKRFVIIGPNHYGLGPEFCIIEKGSWATPLGVVAIDSELAEQLITKCPFLERDDAGHKREHSIEVQLPFLQYRFGSFTFVPISIYNIDYSESLLKYCVQLGTAIAGFAKKYDIGMIASSDFSHYLPLDIAKDRDELVIEKITSLDLQGFFRTLARIGSSVCGYGPIAVAMAAAKELELKVKLLGSSNSGDISGDFSSVVTYYAIGFYK
jgi:AmmeMemoRadiSam system protein B